MRITSLKMTNFDCKFYAINSKSSRKMYVICNTYGGIRIIDCNS